MDATSYTHHTICPTWKHAGQIALLLLLLGAGRAQAQYELEALRYSHYYTTGTARYVGMGGAFGSLGGDLTCISNNPAGLGLFRNSQITVSPSLFFTGTTADYEGVSFSDSKFNFNFGNIGMVYAKRFNKDKTTGLQFLNFALAYNRVNNFNRSFYLQGSDSLYSLGTLYSSQSQGYVPGSLDNFHQLLGFNTYLIDTSGSNTTYISNGPQPGQWKQMVNRTDRRGSVGDIALSGSANFSNKFYVGATISLSMLNYKNTYNYSETDLTAATPFFDAMTYTENVDVSGIGINLRLGFIYRPLNWLRVGAAIHSPTWYDMSENYFTKLSTSFTFGRYTSQSPVGSFDYDLRTPWRFQGSAAFIIAKIASIGLEYEYADYSSINLRSGSASFINAKAFIDTAYTASHNVRVGAELVLKPFHIRAGYHFQMNPFVSSLGLDGSVHHITAGLGYNSRKWFKADIAYMVSLSKGRESMFSQFNLPPAQLSLVNHSIVISVGVSF